VDLYKFQLQETKKAFNILNHEYCHTNEILREHNEIIQGYMVKINRLEEKVINIQRTSTRNVITSFLITLLTWLLSLIAVIILCITTTIDFGKKFTLGSDSDANTITKRTGGVLLKMKQNLTKFAQDFHLIERAEVGPIEMDPIAEIYPNGAEMDPNGVDVDHHGIDTNGIDLDDELYFDEKLE